LGFPGLLCQKGRLVTSRLTRVKKIWKWSSNITIDFRTLTESVTSTITAGFLGRKAGQ